MNQAHGIELKVNQITFTPDNLTVGTPVMISAVVRNNGDIASPAQACKVKFVIDGTTTLYATDYTASIPSQTVTAALTVNSGTWSVGQHSVVATVNYDGSINEATINQANNSTESVFYVH